MATNGIRRRAAAPALLLLGLAVLIMHAGLPQAHGTAPAHHAPSPAVAAHAHEPVVGEHHPVVQKKTLDAVHDHAAHECMGTVAAHKTIAAPPLVAVLPLADAAPGATRGTVGARARGPPPWTILGLSDLCVLRL